jgi:bifunctional non-homologous end joining protein LigD
MNSSGYRGVGYVEPGRVRILSRNNNPLLPQFPELEVLQRVVGRHRVVLDGEIVAVGRDGRPDFGLLQHRRGAPSRFALAKAPVQYFIFDLLYLDGRSLLEPSRTGCGGSSWSTSRCPAWILPCRPTGVLRHRPLGPAPSRW